MCVGERYWVEALVTPSINDMNDNTSSNNRKIGIKVRGTTGMQTAEEKCRGRNRNIKC